MQAAISSMEATMKGVLTEQGDVQKWKPEIERKVTEFAEVLKKTQAKADPKSLIGASNNKDPVVDGALGSVHQELPSLEAAHGQFRHRSAHPYRRPGARTDEVWTPPPVGGTNYPPQFGNIPWSAGGMNSMGNWSQCSGSVAPSMTFPVFDGNNPKLWRQRCETYFDFYSVARGMWIRMAIMNFVGTATFWLQSVENRLGEMSWEEFCGCLNARFGRDQHSMLIRQFYHIHQTNSVSEYVEQFDVLLHQLLAHEGQLTPAMITARFLDGLKEEVRSVVVIQRPNNLDAACSLALLQEDVLMHSGRREHRRQDGGGFSKPLQKGTTMVGSSLSATTNRVAYPASASRLEDSKLTALKAYRKAKGLCFKCGEKWGHAHRCSNTVPLHLVEEMWALTVTGEEEEQTKLVTEGGVDSDGEAVLSISVNAVSGSEGNRTVRLWALIQRQQLLVLVDSGSSTSFMSDHLMGKVTGVQSILEPVQVKVADGRCLWSKYFVPGCQWLCGGITFHTDFKFLPLSGYDIILGMDWLEAHSPMKVHWVGKWLEFEYESRVVRLQGVVPKLSTCHQLSKVQLNWILKQEAWEHILELSVEDKGQSQNIPFEMAQLVEEYHELFDKPAGLPPPREVDHTIPLLSGAQPFRLRPYRYTPNRKMRSKSRLLKCWSKESYSIARARLPLLYCW